MHESATVISFKSLAIVPLGMVLNCPIIIRLKELFFLVYDLSYD